MKRRDRAKTGEAKVRNGISKKEEERFKALRQIRDEEKLQGENQSEVLSQKNFLETKYGRLVVEDLFGKMVRIYENGYVQIFGTFGGKNAPFEKLLGISSSYEHKRDGGYLTISTDYNTHALHVGGRNMDNAYINRLHRLATAGQAVLDSLKSRQESSASQTQANDAAQKSNSVADEITKLLTLRDSGALTDEEFQTLKKKLL